MSNDPSDLVYEVLQDTVVDGWVNCTTDNGGDPFFFGTLEAARQDIEEDLLHIHSQVVYGERSDEDDWTTDDFMIRESLFRDGDEKPVPTGRMFAVEWEDGVIAEDKLKLKEVQA